MILIALWDVLTRRSLKRRRRTTPGLQRHGDFPTSLPASQHIERLEDRTLLSSVSPLEQTIDPIEQTIIFNQPANFPNDFNYWTSSLDSAFTVGAVMYDDFFFTAETEFDNVVWQGLYEADSVFDNPAEANTATWRINIWADNGFGTGPGSTLLLSQDFAAGNVNFQFAGFANLGSGVQAPVFNFATNLQAPFTARANTIYWLSILSIAEGGNDPIWGWMSGIGDDNSSVQQILGGADDLVRLGDRAFRFVDLEGPSAPTPLNPIGTVSDTRPTFSWTAVADAARYDLWVNVLGTNEVVIRNANIVGTTFRPNFSLSPDTSYIWTVRGITAAGILGDWADHAIFRIESDLAAPTLIRPSGTASLMPTFEWTAVPNADHYDIWVNVFGVNTLVIRDRNVPSNTFTPSQPLQADQRYIWTVRAISSTGAPGDWAAHLTFRTVGTAAAPNIIAPVGTSGTTVPTFRWTPIVGATRYDIWVNVFGSNQLVIRNANVTSTNFLSPVVLTQGQTYIWTVRGFVNGIPTAWAAHRTFRVASTSLGPETSPMPPAVLGTEDDADEFGRPGQEESLSKATVAVLPEERAAANDVDSPQAAEKIDEVMQEWVRMDWWAWTENRSRRGEPV